MAEEALRNGAVLVVGVGNPNRGDDGAGLRAVRALRNSAPDHVELVEADGEASGLIALLSGARAAFVIDACASGAPAGTVHRFDVTTSALPQSGFSISSHGLGLHQAIELARALGALPVPCVVYAVEGEVFDIGEQASPAVAAGASEAATRVRAELARLDRQA